MQDPLPAFPQGGYYVIEVTGGFVNNSFINNQIDLAGKASTGMDLNGEDYGSRIKGNTFLGGSSGNTVFTDTAISLTAEIGSAPSGTGAFPLPAGWTALPNLGTVVEDNTIRDFLGGIMVGVQHDVNYWQAEVETDSETGRVFLTASVRATSSSMIRLSFRVVGVVCFLRQQSRADVDAADGDDRQRLEPAGSRPLRQPAISLDGRRRHHRQRCRFADLRRPAENVVTVQANTGRNDRSKRGDHDLDRRDRPGLRRHGQRHGRRADDCHPDVPESALLSVQLENLDVSGARSRPRRPRPSATTSAPPLRPRRHHHLRRHRRRRRPHRRGRGAGRRESDRCLLECVGRGELLHRRAKHERWSWMVVAPSVTTTFFLDTGLAYSTITVTASLPLRRTAPRRRARPRCRTGPPPDVLRSGSRRGRSPGPCSPGRSRVSPMPTRRQRLAVRGQDHAGAMDSTGQRSRAGWLVRRRCTSHVRQERALHRQASPCLDGPGRRASEWLAVVVINPPGIGSGSRSSIELPRSPPHGETRAQVERH